MKKIIIFLALIMTTESMAQNSPNGATDKINQPKTNSPAVKKPVAVNNNVNTNSQVNSIPTTPSKPAISQQAPNYTEKQPNKANIDKEVQIKMDESKEFSKIIAELSPEKKQKLDKINSDFTNKMNKLYAKLETDVTKVSNIKNIIMINDHLFPIKNPQSRALPEELKQKRNAQIIQFNKLTKTQKKATKQEMIKFRKEMMAIQKERRKQIKDLIGKDFSMMAESESEEQIKKDEDLVNAEK